MNNITKYNKYSKKLNSMVAMIGGGFNDYKILTFIKETSALDEDEKQRLFALYTIVYASVEVHTLRVIPNGDSLMSVYSNVIYFTHNDIIFSAFLLNKMNIVYKLSVILHDNTVMGKQYTYDMMAKLLIYGRGYVIEASDAVEHILESRYNIKPNSLDKVQLIFPSEKYLIEAYFRDSSLGESESKSAMTDEGRYIRTTLRSGNRIVGKKLYGLLCHVHTKTFVKNMSLDTVGLNGCKMKIDDDVIYNSHENIFDNLFDYKATFKFLASTFVAYNDLDSESFLSNMIEDKSIVVKNVGTDNTFNVSENGFAFINIINMSDKVSAPSEKKLSTVLQNMREDLTRSNFILDDQVSRTKLRNAISDFVEDLIKSEQCFQIFGKTFDNITAICIDTVPRDTNPGNDAAKFKGINMVHCDIYPHANMGDVIWSFKNTWYDKIRCKTDIIEHLGLNVWGHRNKWNDLIEGIYNFWICLSDEITDNGFAVMQTHPSVHNLLVPYKAYRPASRSNIEAANFISSSLKYNESYEWYGKYKMKYGECFIFNTSGTPHSGFKFNNGSGKHRKSVECRILLLKNVTPSIMCHIPHYVSAAEENSSLPGDGVVVGEAPI